VVGAGSELATAATGATSGTLVVLHATRAAATVSALAVAVFFIARVQLPRGEPLGHLDHRREVHCHQRVSGC